MQRSHLLAWALLLLAPMASEGRDARPTERQLTSEQPRLVYDVRCLERAGAGQFVRVKIARVRNPAMVPLAFQVHFLQPGSEPVYLGGFALFPADNPGRFIVPTGGHSLEHGQIELTMEPLPQGAAADAVGVWVSRIDLADGLDQKP